ncbi:MAG: hypothetical protein L0H29_00240 [Sinobacteraceae bacterium]|nr:hypothetical protein [Nevskiaceae bacterium]
MSGKFSRRRQQGISGDVAGVIRLAFAAGEIASLFGLEGPLRASLRADLCLRGWGWLDAHRAAVDIVNSALMFLGAERPCWNEGQREWTIEAGTLIERTRCIKCHKPLPEGHFKYCGYLCGDAHRHQITALKEGNEKTVLTMAIKTMT